MSVERKAQAWAVELDLVLGEAKEDETVSQWVARWGVAWAQKMAVA